MASLAFANAPAHAFVKIVATLVRRIQSAIRRCAAVNAETRIHKARLEAEVHRNRFRLKTKTDDDLPVIL